MNGINGNSGPPSPLFPPLPESAPSQVYIFKVTSPVALPSTNLPISLPIQGFASTSARSASPSPQIHTHQHSQSQSSAIYPLCTNGWCLTRLRQTCSLWAFIRSGIVEKIWEEEIPNIPTPPPAQAADDKPVVPPRRRGLWGMIGERASSWTEDKEKRKVQLEKEEKDKELDKKMKEKDRELVEKTKTLPPPPVHPAGSRHPSHIVAPTPLVAPPPPPRRSEARRVPPPFVPDADNTLTHSPSDEAPPIEEPSKTPPHPAHIPLPDSRPATPSSPGAPPPLPRRAAARRPISMALPTSRPGTPLAAKDDPVKEKDAEPVTVKIEADESVKDEEPPAKLDEPAKVEEPPATVEEETVAESKADAAAAPSEPAPPASDEVKDTSNESAPPAVPPPLPRRARPPPARPITEEKDSDTPPESSDDDEEEVEVDMGMFIGDATWEERTWKELVKLKEDLFWARVGGLR